MDRQPGPGLETSFANAGEVSPGYSAPWAGPGVPLKAIKWLAMRHRPLVIWPMSTGDVRWSIAPLRNCTEARYEINKAACCASRSTAATVCERAARRRPGSPTTSGRRARCNCFARRRSSTARRRHGDPRALRRRLRAARSRRLRSPRAGVRARAGEVRRRPAPARRRDRRLLQVHAALSRSPRKRASTSARRRTIRTLGRGGDRISVATDAGRSVPMPTWSPSAAIRRALLALARLPFRSIPSRATRSPCRSRMPRAPESTVMDETHKVAVTRLGDRIRVGGTAELCRLHAAPARGAARTLDHVVDRSLPGWRRRRPRRVLDGLPADDAGRHADRRADADSATSSSPPATAPWAGRWPPAPAASSPT